ncbi:VOC family protein [Paenibacillus puerhi]|uniref:VOC family protein n=1 Tax=Paenibacillus puerhi TaxID=2692622 RepID=UPI001357555A|nr:VOC family protein [Paenibacillus puerhi]
MAKPNTYIRSEHALLQAEFYIQALGGELLSVITYGQLPDAPKSWENKVLQISFIAGEIQFLMSDVVLEPLVPGNAITLVMEFSTEAEARQAFANLAYGGKIRQPLEPAFGGSLFGEIEDRFGVLWMITTEAKPGLH